LEALQEVLQKPSWPLQYDPIQNEHEVRQDLVHISSLVYTVRKPTPPHVRYLMILKALTRGLACHILECEKILVNTVSAVKELILLSTLQKYSR
jgi:hypothetical protein